MFLITPWFVCCIVAISGTEVPCTFTTCNSSIPAEMSRDWKDAEIRAWKSGAGTECAIICGMIDVQCSTHNNRFPRISNTSILETLVTHNNRVCTDMIEGNYPFLPGFTTGDENTDDPAVRCLLNGETCDSMCGSGEEPMESLHRLCACSLAPTGPSGGSPERSGVSTTTAPESSGVGTTAVSESWTPPPPPPPAPRGVSLSAQPQFQNSYPIRRLRVPLHIP